MKSLKLIYSSLAVTIILLATNQVHATKWIVNVQNFTFSPANLPNVNVGDTVKWVWVNGTHTTTSTTIPGGAASWDHPITSSNTFYEYPVTVSGSYAYQCTPHAGMGMVGSFTATTVVPVLLSIVPNQAVQTQSFMATITGSNTNFSGTPAVSLSFSNNPAEIINASSVTVISPTVLHAQFTIPPSASVGLWDVNVNTLVLNNGFTVLQAIPAILSMVPSSADQGASFTGNIAGQYTGWSGTPSVSLSFSGNPNEIITGTNVVVLNSTHLTADFTIPSDASPGQYNVHVDALMMTNGFTVIEVVPAITFMTPNTAHQGDSFNGTVFGQNTSWSGTPSVSLSYSNNPSEIINGTNVTVINNTQLTADFSVPSGASTGNYTIHVDALEQANGFTVLAALTPALTGINPDNGIQGELVSTTITAENTLFQGQNPGVSLTISGSPSEVIIGTNVVVVNNTTLTADFDIPSAATPGLWDLNVDELTLQNSFTINEATPYLLSIVPDSATQGDMIMTAITAVNSHFTLSEPIVYLSFSSNPSETIDASDVNVMSDTDLEVMFAVPSDASVGKWDVHVGSMILTEGFTVNLLAGLSDPSSLSVKTYPNPASNTLFIENAAGSEVSLFSPEGNLIYSQKITSWKQVLDVSRFARGIYIVKVKENGYISSEKLLLN
jgi:plastocyanin